MVKPKSARSTLAAENDELNVRGVTLAIEPLPLKEVLPILAVRCDDSMDASSKVILPFMALTGALSSDGLIEALFMERVPRHLKSLLPAALDSPLKAS